MLLDSAQVAAGSAQELYTACMAEGMRMKLGKPCLIDVHVDANIRPPGTGAWALPPIPHMEPVFGKKHVR